MKLMILAAALTAAASAPAPAPAPAPDSFDRMNALGAPPPGCKSIPRQVAGENRRYNGTRLDQQPPGRLLLAVDRQINGCHQVTFARDELRPRH